jgi:hypothetical protein
MGFLKKVTSSIFGGGAPKYNQDKSALTQQYGVISDLGNLNLVKNADGTYSKKFTSSEIDNMRNSLAREGLGAVTLDPQREEQAYYDRATRLLNDAYDRQLANTDEALINRGIQTGTKQYNQVMGDVQNNQLGALSDIANQAIFAGQGYTSGQIGNVNALTGARDIQYVNSMGGANNAYDNAYEAKQYAHQARTNAMNNLLGAGATIGAAALLSDKRAKENLKPVGKLDNGLKVYVGNYKEETGLDTTPQLFLLAQEVEKKNPEAVREKGGYLAVNYKKAVEKK